MKDNMIQVFSKSALFLRRTLKVSLLFFTVHCTVIIYDGMSDELLVSDYAIVLGNKVNLDGEPSERLKSRLDKCVWIYRKGFASRIIVSGGFGKEGFDEAKVMKEYLIQSSIPSEKILMDSEGNNTYLTAKNALDLVEKSDKITIISHYYHISRTKLAFYQFGFENVSGVHANSEIETKEPFAIFREFIAFYYYLIREY